MLYKQIRYSDQNYKDAYMGLGHQKYTINKLLNDKSKEDIDGQAIYR